jgi:hypothetical protein
LAQAKPAGPIPLTPTEMANATELTERPRRGKQLARVGIYNSHDDSADAPFSL